MSYNFNEVVLVTEKDEEVGTMEKMEAHEKGLLHRAFSIFVFNSIPSIAKIVPGGYRNMLLRINIAAPHHDQIDKDAITAVFPYGNIIAVDLQQGGAIFDSGIAIREMGDSSSDMIVVNVAVTVGY